ncbi:hypothetical protein [Streptomyces antimicrobicus]|uniref:C1q domain-containing protein n=1 Tax=Streptomyces antimicrobicus TaxID=2883108 RepID=A0ABS8B4K3_9ACTN|nr:hypothetical protein [Streptomyces antimicrobicus]MCB5179511.1 hypothetical protein [Streptomyces antimicrobicus]
MATVPATQSFLAGEKVTAAKLTAATKTPLDFLMNPPCCAVYTATGIACTSGTSTLVTFDTESWDTDSMHSTVSNTSRVTINTPGQYLVTFYGRFPSNATGYRQLNFRKNSNGNPSGGSTMSTIALAAVNGSQTFITRTFELNCLAGEYFELFALQNSGASLTLDSGQRVTGMEFRWLGN